MSNCYYDGAGCLVCPEQEAQIYLPARMEQHAVKRWDAGANSIDSVDGDLRAAFTQGLGVIGLIIGLKSARTQQIIPSQVEHGWYFQRVGGLDVAQPIERGTVLGSLIIGRKAESIFEIRRLKGVVVYLQDGVVVRVSTAVSTGYKILNCCMYASGDTAAGGT